MSKQSLLTAAGVPAVVMLSLALGHGSWVVAQTVGGGASPFLPEASAEGANDEALPVLPPVAEGGEPLGPELMAPAAADTDALPDDPVLGFAPGSPLPEQSDSPLADAQLPEATPAPLLVLTDDDPFGAPATKAEPTDDDPFGAPSEKEEEPADDDPFAESASDAAPADDEPFAAPAAKAEAKDADLFDPFGSPSPKKDEPADDDPFGGPATEADAPVEDPFGGPASEINPFGDPAAEADAPATEEEDAPAKPAPVVVHAATSASEEAIEEALSEPTTMEFIETPLSDVGEFLKDLHNINIMIDHRALDDLGLDADCEITISVKGLPLESALNLMLREHDLGWTIANEVLMITTPEEAENNLITRVYDVADLVTYRDEDGGVWENYDSLIDVIGSTVRPTTWDDVGGPGSISPGTFGAAKVLVVAQTLRVHRHIAKLLADIRAVAAKQPDNTQPPRKDRPMSGNIPPTTTAPLGGGFMPADEDTFNDDPFGEKSMGGMGGGGGIF